MRLNRQIQLTLMMIVTALAVQAQNLTMSPYSRFGYGLLNDNASSMQRAMGGVGYAMNSGRQINVMNPASYGAIDSLTFLFDMGTNLDLLWTQENNLKEDNISGGLDYITLAFPIAKRIGASIGLLPFSSTGYSFNDSIANATTLHDGSGSINEAYVGVGVNPVGGLYVGANFSYMFGSMVNDIYAYTINNSTALFQRYTNVRDWRLDLGIQYSLKLNANNRVTLGATYAPGKDLRGETYGIYYDATLDTSVDTIGYTNLKGNYSLPATYGGGINYQWRDRLMVEADFLYQPWKDVKYASIEGFDSSSFDNRWKAVLGLQYTPAPRGTYIQRIQYRMGAYYNHDYLMVRGNNVREYGVTMGFGFPVPNFKTVINLGVQYKHRQAHPNPLVKEDYLNITLGINFNEVWFNTFKLH